LVRVDERDDVRHAVGVATEACDSLPAQELVDLVACQLARDPSAPSGTGHLGRSVGHTESVMLRVSLLTALCVALVAAGAVAAALLAWPTVGVAASSSGLAG